jgi:hypothetical protein
MKREKGHFLSSVLVNNNGEFGRGLETKKQR